MKLLVLVVLLQLVGCSSFVPPGSSQPLRIARSSWKSSCSTRTRGESLALILCGFVLAWIEEPMPYQSCIYYVLSMYSAVAMRPDLDHRLTDREIPKRLLASKKTFHRSCMRHAAQKYMRVFTPNVFLSNQLILERGCETCTAWGTKHPSHIPASQRVVQNTPHNVPRFCAPSPAKRDMIG